MTTPARHSGHDQFACEARKAQRCVVSALVTSRADWAPARLRFLPHARRSAAARNGGVRAE